MYPDNWPLPHHTHQHLNHLYNDKPSPHDFINALPPFTTITSNSTPEATGRITRQSIYSDDIDGGHSNSSNRPHANKSLPWPAFAVTVPLVLLSAALLGIVFGYRVDEGVGDLFADGAGGGVGNGTATSGGGGGGGGGYILVDFSATRLVFAASFLSTVAPLLTAPTMTLWSVVSSTSMSKASANSRFGLLPTPYQLSILVGLCLASMEQFRVYLWYSCSRKRKIAIPPVVDKAGLVMLLALGVAAGVFVSDTVLHYLTSTVVFERYAAVDQPGGAFGRGLSKLCLDLDRVQDNGGFPCSIGTGFAFTDPNATENYNEISRLQSNESTASQIRITEAVGLDANLALVLTNPETLDLANDFKASTVGVSTSCKLVPPESCSMQASGTGRFETRFNCTNSFFGLLGKDPNTTATNDGSKPIDPDLSPLAFKSSSNLQYAFFTDSSLQTIYNPEAWDPATNVPDFKSGLPDSALLNPIYAAFAIQAYRSIFSLDSEMLTSSMVYNNSNNILSFILSCAITTHDVSYVWHKSSLQNIVPTASPNGTLLEVFHGNQVYGTVAGAFDLQFNLVSAGLAGSKISDYLGKWQDLYSVKVLSHIGGHLTPRSNLVQQHRQEVLVARVPKAALGSLVGCALLYSLLGGGLVVVAWRKGRGEGVGRIAEQLSLLGLVEMAFGGEGRRGEGEKDGQGGGEGGGDVVRPYAQAGMEADSGTTLMEERARAERGEMRRVRIEGTDFQVWV